MIERFFFAPGQARFASFLRIAVALLALVQMSVLAPSWLDLYGSEGYVEWIISQELFRIEILPTIGDVSERLRWLGVSDNEVVLAIAALYAVALVLLALGWRTRLAAVAAWLLHLTLNNTAIVYGYGVETFTHVGLFYLIWFPAAQHCSLDARAGRVRSQPASASARCAQRVLQLHLCLVYVNAGAAKMTGTDWWTGEAIWRSVAQPAYNQFDVQWLAWVPWVSMGLSWWTLAIETLYPIMMFRPKIGRFWLANVILLHLGIGFVMGLYLFGAIMIILNVAAYGWDDVETMTVRLRQAIAHRVWRLRPTVVSSEGIG